METGWADAIAGMDTYSVLASDIGPIATGGAGCTARAPRRQQEFEWEGFPARGRTPRQWPEAASWESGLVMATKTGIWSRE